MAKAPALPTTIELGHSPPPLTPPEPSSKPDIGVVPFLPNPEAWGKESQHATYSKRTDKTNIEK